MTTTQVGSPTTPAPVDLTTTQADPSGTPIIDLTTCMSVTYEMRDDLPGVKFTRDGHTEWTPIQKRDTDKATDHEEGDGTRRAPHRAAMKKLQFEYAREVKVMEPQVYYLDVEIPAVVMSGYL